MATEITTDNALPLCQCGCGDPVRERGNKFLRGHHRRVTNTAVKQKTESKNGDVILFQDMELAQQLIGKVLNGSRDKNTINIITVGPIQVDNNRSESNKGTKSSNDLLGSLRELYRNACSNGELSEVQTERRIEWLLLCEKALL